MSQPKDTDLAVDKLTGKLPEPKLEFKPKSPQTGYEEVYGTTQRSSSSSRRKPLGWFEDVRKNIPQSRSLTAATMIFSTGGMNLASSIGFGPINLYRTHIQFSWFIAVIIGSCFSTFLVHKISKRIFNLVASVLVILSGILYITATQSTSTILLARYVDGIAFGLTLIPSILAGSEQSVKRFRGFVLSAEQTGLAVGALIKLISMGNLENRRANGAHGVIAIIFGVIALICTFVFTVESPVFLLNKDYEEEALNALRRLQRPKVITHETYALLNEHKELLEEDMNRENGQNMSSGWIPMLKMILFRCIVSMSISFPLTLTFLLATSLSSRSGIPISIYVYIFMRLVGTIFSIFFLDNLGRRIPSAVSSFVGGGILIVVGWLTTSSFDRAYHPNIQPVVFLMLLYQLLCGIIAPVSTCYLGEAFSVSVKPYFILGVITAENILQVLVCCLLPTYNISYFAWTFGGIQALYGVLYFFTMPETMQTTLREALKLFQKLFFVMWTDEADEENDVYGDGEGSPV